MCSILKSAYVTDERSALLSFMVESEAVTSRKDARGSSLVRTSAEDGADSVRHRAHDYEPKTYIHGNGYPKTPPYASLSAIARA